MADDLAGCCIMPKTLPKKITLDPYDSKYGKLILEFGPSIDGHGGVHVRRTRPAGVVEGIDYGAKIDWE